MWQCTRFDIAGGQRCLIGDGSSPLSFAAVFELLAADESFADWYSQVLAGFPGSAFFWEMPGLSSTSIERNAEFVMIGAPDLAGVAPEPGPFSRRFADAADKSVVVFPNLGGDAQLVVPAPRGRLEAYPHLAAFLRAGPRHQVAELWRAVAATLLQGLTDRPTWVSTSGLGVYWLHVRLDSTPKYYQYQPYRG